MTKRIQQKYDKESEQCNLFTTHKCFVSFKEKILLRNVFPHLSFPPKPNDKLLLLNENEIMQTKES